MQKFWCKKYPRKLCSFPLSIAYVKAASSNPPLQPKFPYDLEQSIICFSENEIKSFQSSLFLIAQAPSNAPHAANAQQEPQAPWSYTKKLKIEKSFK